MLFQQGHSVEACWLCIRMYQNRSYFSLFMFRFMIKQFYCRTYRVKIGFLEPRAVRVSVFLCIVFSVVYLGKLKTYNKTSNNKLSYSYPPLPPPLIFSSIRPKLRNLLPMLMGSIQKVQRFSEKEFVIIFPQTPPPPSKRKPSKR